MSFWKDFFTKKDDHESNTDSISIGNSPSGTPTEQQEPPAPEKPEPTYQEYLDRVCQSFGTRDSVLATAAFQKVTPVDMHKPYTYISDRSPRGRYYVPEAKPMPAPRTTSIKLTPFFAEIYELGSDSPELADVLDDAIKSGTFSRNSYFAAGEMSTALLIALARKEDKHMNEVYADLEKNMFPDGKNKESVAYDSFRLAGHYIGLPGLEYKTFSDIYAHLYCPLDVQAPWQHFPDRKEQTEAFEAVKEMYLADPDKDLAIAVLADGWQDIISILQKPVSKRTARIIANDERKEAHRWLVASKNIDPNAEHSKVDPLEDRLEFFRFEAPLDRNAIKEELKAFEEFLPLREKVSEWYSLMQDKDSVSEHTERIEELEDEISESLHSPVAFALSNEILIGNATGDIVREYETLATLRRDCTLEHDFDPRGFLGSTFVQYDEMNGQLTGWGPFEERFDIIKEDGAKLLAEEIERREEEAKAEAARKELEEAEAALKAAVENHKWKKPPEEELT